jgi:hypothetical protein
VRPQLNNGTLGGRRSRGEQLSTGKLFDAIASVLRKVGVNPAERFDAFDQDAQYTACRPEELAQYYELYVGGVVDDLERYVLCCFMLEALNDFCSEGATHSLQSVIFDALLDAGDVHAHEIAYWTDTSDPDPENWWPITKPFLAHQASRAMQPRSLAPS